MQTLRNVSRVVPSLLCAAALTGCGSCQRGPASDLRVEGPTPYVRCLADEPPDDRSFRMGAFAAEVTDGVLRLRAQGPVRLAVFSGPAPSTASIDEALALLPEVELLVVLGGLGDSEAQAAATLAALAATDTAVLFIAGGRDDAVVLATVFEDLESEATERVLNATALERIVIGGDALVPIGGAPGGRYARTDTACGYGEEDLRLRAEALGAAGEGERRWLLSWAAPTGLGPGIEGAEVGDDGLASFAETVGAAGGLHAWPRELAGLGVEGGHGPQRVVSPIAGPASERADGTRVLPRPLILRLDEGGLGVAEEPPPADDAAH